MINKNFNFVCIDIGDSKISVLAAHILHEKKCDIVHKATYGSQGFNNSFVKDFVLAEKIISKIIDSTEKAVGASINSVVVVISSASIESHYITHHHTLKSDVIKKSDINTIAFKAMNESKVSGSTIIHCFPVDFHVDDQKHLSNPIGMSGNKLTCDFHMISVNSSVVKGLIDCFAKCNVNVEEFLLSSVVEGLACCTTNLSEANEFMTIDVGYRSTIFTVFLDKKPIFSDSINIGGDHATADLAQILSIKHNLAEKTKILFCNLDKSDSLTIDVTKLGPSETNQEKILETKLVNDIVRARVKEMFMLIKDVLRSKNAYLLKAARKTLLAGRTSNLKGIKSVCANVFDALDVTDSIEYHNHNLHSKLDSIYSSTLGALQYRLNNYCNYHSNLIFNKNSIFTKFVNLFKKLLNF